MHDRARLRPYFSLSRAKHTRISIGSCFVVSYFCDAGLSPEFRSVGRSGGTAALRAAVGRGEIGGHYARLSVCLLVIF